MLFIIHCLDKADALPRRLAAYNAHKAYLAAPSIGILMSGPLVADDGETMIGSFFLVEAESREDVEVFNRMDPFNEANVWDSVKIHPFIKRQG